MDISDIFWQKIKNREESSFSVFYENYYPLLYGRVSKFIDDREERKEIVQNTFVSFWQKAETISPEKHYMEAYLWQILRSQISRFYRNKKDKILRLEEFDKNHPVLLHLHQTENDENIKDLTSILEAAIESLPEKTKDIFLRSRVNGHTYKEIAKELNLSQKTIEYHISNALRTLRKKLKSFL